MIQAVTEIIKTFADVELRFSLQRSNSLAFFPEWHENLPEINPSETEA